MSKEHEAYIKKVKRDRIKIAVFRVAILLIFIVFGNSGRILPYQL